MQINFSQPSLIKFTKGAEIFGHDCISPSLIASNVDGLQIIYSPVMELSKGICPIYSDANYIKKKIKKKKAVRQQKLNYSIN